MRYSRLLLFLASFLAALSAAQQDSSACTACQLLNDTLPGLVFFSGSSDYTEDDSHFAASSTQNSTCTLQILGRDDVRAPFAVKGGGHSSNVRFSSTTGVQISLENFNQIIPDPYTNTLQLGPSATWDEAYAALDPFNQVSTGARIPGVGVGGVLLGGGYGWVTDEYGLAIDNILSWDLILPNGTFVQVTEESHPELAFGLRGGFNNFGIVTSFTIKTHPGNQVWAGTVTFSLDVIDQVFAALENYSFNHTDEKAGLLLQYSAASTRAPAIMAHLCYHAPVSDVPEVFSELLSIPALNDTAHLTTLSQFLLESFGSFLNPRVGFAQHAIPIIHYTEPILRSIQAQVNATVAKAIADGTSIISASVGSEPLIHPFVDPKDSAYPHSTARQITPANVFIFYNNVSDRDYMSNAIREFSLEIQKVAIEEGWSRPDDILYSNYAVAGTPLELIYGDNIERLRALKKIVDPTNVMGLTGGWKVPV
ncbi:hypothetical protein D9758_013041 [Tetrapyrgos nigripes]|uniref:FAD-binding PCMH-type domain-containing protein n=1 Tax=Tetrapyrgos nigripes TaxID=182062 RepID=A0A8H5FQR7_9AGAR|nr:hypothetical protein D9758_013041 [Tetrapyrgos nigripes]